MIRTWTVCAVVFWAASGAIGDARASAQSTAVAAPPASNYSAFAARSAALSPEDRAHANALFKTAFSLWQSGDFAAAEMGFKQGLDIDPANGPANYYYGDILQRRGDPAAREFIARAATLAADSPEGLKAQALISQWANEKSTEVAAAAARAEQEKQAQTWIIGTWKIRAKCSWGSSQLTLNVENVEDGDIKLTGGAWNGSFRGGRLDGLHVQLHWGNPLNKAEFEGELTSSTAMAGSFSNSNNPEACHWSGLKNFG